MQLSFYAERNPFCSCLQFFIITLYSRLRNDGQQFGAPLYQKARSDLETGVQLSWKMGSNDTTFGLACKYQLDGDASVRAKVNNNSQIGLGYQQKLRDGKLFLLYYVSIFFLL